MIDFATPRPGAPRGERHALVYRLARLMFGAGHRQRLFQTLDACAASGLRDVDALAHLWVVLTRDGTQRRYAPLALFAAAGTTGLTPAVYEAVIEKEATLAQVRGLMLGTAVLLFGLLLAILAVGYFTVAGFFQTLPPQFSAAQLSPNARLLHDLSYFMHDYIVPLVLAPPVLAAAVLYLQPRLTGRLRRLLDYLYPFDLYRTAAAADLMSALAITTSGGIEENRALEALERRAAPYLREKIQALRASNGVHLARLADIPREWPDYETVVTARLLARHPKPDLAFEQLSASLIQGLKRSATLYNNLFYGLATLFLTAFILWLMFASNEVITSLTQSIARQ